MRRATLAATTLMVLVPLAASAIETPMTAEEFEEYVSGKTLYYSSQGVSYGAEQYLSDRRVIWTFLNEECQFGRWYEAEGMICFVYELDLRPQCWTFWATDDGLLARFENDPQATELYETRQSDEPLQCEGPKVGT